MVEPSCAEAVYLQVLWAEREMWLPSVPNFWASRVRKDAELCALFRDRLLSQVDPPWPDAGWLFLGGGSWAAVGCHL